MRKENKRVYQQITHDEKQQRNNMKKKRQIASVKNMKIKICQ